MDTHGYQAPSHMSTIGVESKGELFFKYFEPDSPYERIPFVDKVCSPIIMFGSNFQHSCFPKFTNFMICTPLKIPCAGAESDQQVNICSLTVRCDQRWLSTQCHRVYTRSGNVPYVQLESVGDFIPEPRCSKFAVGLQTRRRRMGGTRAPIGRAESDRSSAMS